MEARKVFAAATLLDYRALVCSAPVKVRSESFPSLAGVNPNGFQFVWKADGATNAAPVSQLLSIAPVQVRAVALTGVGLATRSARSAAAEVRRRCNVAYVSGPGATPFITGRESCCVEGWISTVSDFQISPCAMVRQSPPVQPRRKKRQDFSTESLRPRFEKEWLPGRPSMRGRKSVASFLQKLICNISVTGKRAPERAPRSGKKPQTVRLQLLRDNGAALCVDRSASSSSAPMGFPEPSRPSTVDLLQPDRPPGVAIPFPCG